jgi:hypothetical protein
MTQIDYNKLFTVCVHLCDYNHTKTISPKMVQCAFRILYMDNPLCKNAVTNATKYVTLHTSLENSKISNFKKASKLKKSLRKFLDTTAQDLRLCDYRIGTYVPIYLCGLDDTFDNTYKEQLEYLKNPVKKETSTKSKSKKDDPVPEDVEEEEDEEEEESVTIEDDEEELVLEEEEEEPEIKPKAKTTKTTKTTKSKSANV